MNSLSKYFKFYVLGILIAAIISSLTHCSDENSTSPADNFGTETEQVKRFNETVISAFESGDKQTVLNLMYDEYKEIYSNELNAAPEKMQTFANALKNKKLVFANEMYAEYELTIDGNVFTIAYSNSGDGVWKLHRF